ncbi:MAG: hypothetical protein JW909_08525 [Planctomycetes bacterium]|nr:hypothetical protein [Planctomycetota bacterium]
MKRGILLAVLLLPGPARALEWRSERYNCVIVLPDGSGWQPMDDSEKPRPYAFMARNLQAAATFSVLVANRSDRFPVLDEEYIARFEKGALGNGGEKLSGRTFSFRGVPAYQLAVRPPTEGFETRMVGLVFMAGDYTYSLNVFLAGDNPDAARCDEFFESFNFIQPPDPAVPAVQKYAALRRILRMAISALTMVLVAGLVIRALKR